MNATAAAVLAGIDVNLILYVFLAYMLQFFISIKLELQLPESVLH